MNIGTLHTAIIIPAVATIMGLFIGLIKYQFGQLRKEVTALKEDFEELQKEINGVRFNYLDRFDSLKTQISSMDLCFNEKITKLTTLFEFYLKTKGLKHGQTTN